MKTNIAYLGNTVNQVVENQNDDALLSAPVGETVIVGGFRVADKEVRLKKAKIKRQEYKKDRDVLSSKLNQIEVVPMVIIPLVAWKQICQKADLLQLHPNDNGMVKVSLDSIFLVGNKNPIYKTEAEILSQICFLKENPNEVFRKFFPTGDDLGPSKVSLLTRIILPEPPEEIKNILIKMNGFNLTVVAAKDAVGFEKDPAEIIFTEYIRIRVDGKQKEEQRRAVEEERLRRLACPIICLENGTAIAILCQFGDFPIEQEVVDEVCASSHLIL